MLGFNQDDLKRLDAYFTVAETVQQPQAWRDTCGIIEKRKDEIKDFMNKNINVNTRIVFTGAGTSAYAGDVVYQHIKKVTGAYAESIPTTDIVLNPADILEDRPTVLVSFARSGNSPESVGAFNIFDSNLSNILHVVITCDKNGELAKTALANSNNLVLIMPEQTNDKGFAMTSSFTSMMLAALLAFDINNLEKNKEYVEIIVEQGEGILSNQWQDIKKLSELNKNRLIYLGSKYSAELGRELMLKNLELTNGKIPTMHESILGFRHGPKTFVNDESLIVVFSPMDDYLIPYTTDILSELYNDSGSHTVVAISYNNKPGIKSICDEYLTVDGKDVPQIFTVFNYALYGQILAIFNSLRVGNTPDNPNPAGAVNRVVKGVNIYEYKKEDIRN